MIVRCLSSSVVSQQELKRWNFGVSRHKIICFKVILLSFVYAASNNLWCKCRTTKRGAENCGKEAKRNDIIDINLGKLYLISDTLTIIFCFLYD